MSKIVDGKYTDDKANMNCHEYCPLAKMCRYEKGEIGLDVYECSMYYKLDDIRNDARDIEEEQRRAAGLKDWETLDDL